MKSAKKSSYALSPARKSVAIPIESQAQPNPNEGSCTCQGYTCPYYVCFGLIALLFVAILAAIVLGIMKIVKGGEPVVDLGPQ